MTTATMNQLDATLDGYLEMVGKTAVYPEATEGTLRSLAYVTAGLASETAELLEKVVDPSTGVTATQAELGDVSWYFVSAHRELGLDATPVLRSAVLGIRDVDSPGKVGLLSALDSVSWVVASAGRVSGLFKKAIRDDAGALTCERRDRLEAELENLIAQWVFVHLALGLDCEQTLRLNAEKLLDRKDRGVIAGDGDNR